MTAMGMRSDLVAFIAARLDEDEEIARYTMEASLSEAVKTMGGDGRYKLWLARRDPARALREVTSLRHVLFACNPLPDATALYILFSLAAIWADHADYRREWTADS